MPDTKELLIKTLLNELIGGCKGTAFLKTFHARNCAKIFILL
jgi:hypothetical protein